jgi:hypothetical protein
VTSGRVAVGNGRVTSGRAGGGRAMGNGNGRVTSGRVAVGNGRVTSGRAGGGRAMGNGNGRAKSYRFFYIFLCVFDNIQNAAMHYFCISFLIWFHKYILTFI